MATDTPTPAATPTQPQAPPPGDLKVLWTRAALFFAIIGALGSLHLSINMELKACPLCFYQRAFIMSAAAVLLFGMFLPSMPAGAQTVLAMGPAFAGFCIAGQHSRLVLDGTLECPAGLTGLAVPYESFIVFTLLIACLLGDLLHRGQYLTHGVCAMLLGFLFCSTSLKATPPAPEPTAPYVNDIQKDPCRRPYFKND